jgi:V-type H+-transporting ATPase subunit E
LFSFEFYGYLANPQLSFAQILFFLMCSLEKQTLIHSGKAKINEQLAQMERDHEVQQRIARSNAITASRTKRMEARNELLKSLEKDAYAELAKESEKPGYKQLVEQLIVQGLVTLENETAVEVCCRKEDQAIVKGCLDSAAAAFKKKTNATGKFTLTLSNQTLPSAIIAGVPSGPGVVITARQGTIVCDNTLGKRLELVRYDKLPEIRSALFP